MSSVVQLTPIPFGDNAVVGGGERYPTELSRAMARYVPTTLVSFAERYSVRREGNLTLKIYPALRYVDHKRVNPLSPWFLPDLLGAQVIHCHQYQTLLTNLAVLSGWTLRKKTFATDHGGGGRNYGRRLGVERKLTGFLPVSRFSASFYPSMAPKTAVIDSGVDPNVFQPQPVERERSVLYVGRLLPHKGIDYLVQAVGTDVPLRVIGRVYDQPYYDYLCHLAEGKRVTFVTNATDRDILQAYSRATVTVLPSVFVSYNGRKNPLAELLGITLLESMACETPVVCTNVGGMPEAVVEGETGYVVPPNDPTALADRLYRLLDDPPLARSMGRAARERILGHWTWDHVARRCLEAYGWGGKTRAGHLG